MYLLKSKAEVSQVVLQFCEMITTQIAWVVKHFRSDNGKEFFNAIVNSYFIKIGGIHESSCINTSQQNELVEKRISCILATTKALLFLAHVQNMYWGEALRTAVHFINQSPSKLYGHQSLINVLNSKYLAVKLTFGFV